MSILRDILDFKNELTGMTPDSIKSSVMSPRRGSIAKDSSTGVLQFPLLVTTALSLEETSMISKALERQYVSFVSIITSIDSVTDEKSVKDYIQRIHQNYNGELIRDSAVFSLPIVNTNLMKRFKESEETTIGIMKQIKLNSDECFDAEDDTVVHYDELEEDEKKQVAVKIKKTCMSEGIEKCFIYNIKNGINSIILNEHGDNYKQVLIIKNINTNDIRLVESASFPVTTKAINIAEASRQLVAESNRLLKDYVPDFNLDVLNDKTLVNENYAIIGTGYMKNKYRRDKLTEAEEVEVDVNSIKSNNVNLGSTVLKDVLRDSDVKKANELVPTMMHLKTYFKDASGALNAVDYLIGIKTIIYPMKSTSVIENIVKCSKRGKGFFNLMRLTTGEISFFKDFVFAISTIKGDIKTKYKDNPWVHSLLRRAKYAKILKTFNFKQQLVPNASIVLTMDEVEILRTEHNIDVMDVSKAKDIMNQLFLLSFVVVDSSVKTVHFLFDQQNSYQLYSYNSLERENSNSAKEVQNIMQVLGRM